jgi:hypothetical protein
VKNHPVVIFPETTIKPCNLQNAFYSFFTLERERQIALGSEGYLPGKDKTTSRMIITYRTLTRK